MTTGEVSWFWRLVGACVGYLPAVLVLIGLTAALYGLRAGAAPLAWLLVAFAVVVGLFGNLLDLPRWALDVSPFHLLPALPADDFSLLRAAFLTVLAAGLGLAGAVLLRRRDVEG